ncbi:hypothetical protein AAG906_035514 [Vitis piasezkii]
MRSSNMAKRYAILQKKLQELESQLNQVISFPSATPCHQLLAESIQQRFLFFNNLLSAETVSHPKRPHHLRHIAQRLTELESAFHAWDEFRTSAPDHVETGSACSCTESCLNDDGGDGCWEMGSLVYEDPEGFFEGAGEEKKEATEAVAREAERDERDVRREEGERVLIGGGCGVLVVGVALVSLVILKFSSFDYRHEFFLAPT